MNASAPLFFLTSRLRRAAGELKTSRKYLF
jgi:hypothetical protein